MIFRIGYWRLLVTLLLLNLVAIVLTAGPVLYSEPHHRFAYAEFSGGIGYMNFAFWLFLAFEGPPLFIYVDRAAGVVKYQRLFRSFTEVVLKYDRVDGRFIIRSIGRNRTARVWALFYNGQEKFYVNFGTGWTDAKLEAVNDMLNRNAW
ncbi:hypothetical protein KB206_09990 [Microvirga sp. STS02]|nr:hypothetical protein [Microvirga sp. STS02]MBR7208949.1 hypothetical protein [Microvirga sp. STS02]